MAASLLAPLKLLAVFVLLFGAGVVACVLEGASYVLVRPFSLKLHRRLVTLVSHAFLLVGTLLLQRWSRIRLVTHGDALPKMASAMFIVNHCSNIDWLVGLAWLARSGYPSPGNAKCVVKASLGSVPIFGWVLRLSEFVFLTRSWDRDRRRFLDALRSLSTFQHTNHPLHLILFPEGSRLTADKLANSQKYAQNHGYPIFQHVLLPRFKGFEVILEELRPHVDLVVDSTLIFDGAKPSMHAVMAGDCDTVIHVYVRKYAVKDVPNDEEGVQKWLLERWAEKEALIAGFKVDPASIGPPCDPVRDVAPSVSPLYALFAVFVSFAAPILYMVSRVPGGLRYLLMANFIVLAMVGVFIAGNLRPSQKGRTKKT